MSPLVDGPGALLAGRTAVVTGGGAGIGAATSRLLARHGAHVFVVDIDSERAAGTTRSITEAGDAATAVTCDVTDAAQVDDLRAIVLRAESGLDVLVNNAGDWIRNVGEFSEGGPDHWDDLHRINFLHILLVTRAFLPAMTAAGAGSIVNVSSVEGLRGYPVDPVYAAYKAAAVHFTRSLAVQVGRYGVRVNGIGPDVTESLQVPYSEWIPAEQRHMWPMWVPVGRMGHPDDQARAVLFLASDLSSFVTGHTIPTDGGTLAGGGWYRSARQARGWTNRPVEP